MEATDEPEDVPSAPTTRNESKPSPVSDQEPPEEPLADLQILHEAALAQVFELKLAFD